MGLEHDLGRGSLEWNRASRIFSVTVNTARAIKGIH